MTRVTLGILLTVLFLVLFGWSVVSYENAVAQSVCVVSEACP